MRTKYKKTKKIEKFVRNVEVDMCNGNSRQFGALRFFFSPFRAIFNAYYHPYFRFASTISSQKFTSKRTDHDGVLFRLPSVAPRKRENGKMDSGHSCIPCTPNFKFSHKLSVAFCVCCVFSLHLVAVSLAIDQVHRQNKQFVFSFFSIFTRFICRC